MTAFARRHSFSRSLSTPRHSAPRLLGVGLVVYAAACHRQRPAVPTPAPVQPPPQPAVVTVNSGPALIQAMHDRYANRWYRTLTFTQKTTVALPSGGQIVQTWYEAAALPGALRIDTDLSSKGGVLYAHDSSYTFNAGKLVSSDARINDLLVLGFDVYAQSAAKTEAVLRRLGFDLSRMHEATWQERPVYVVGALRGDTTSKQFWVDRERLLFVRMLENGRQGHTDTRFNSYAQYGGGWVATQVVQLVNGKRRLVEQYTGVRTDVPLSPALFDPSKWTTAPHWVAGTGGSRR
jgi:hypothetical protein